MKLYKSKPPIKTGEWSVDQGGKAYILFEESIDIPGLKQAQIRIEFENRNSFEEIQALVSDLKDRGFTFVVQQQ